MKTQAERVHLKCKACGASMDDDESVWFACVRWPVKLRFAHDGIGFKVAHMEDQDVISRLEWSEIACDKCESNDIEITFDPEEDESTESIEADTEDSE